MPRQHEASTRRGRRRGLSVACAQATMGLQVRKVPLDLFALARAGFQPSLNKRREPRTSLYRRGGRTNKTIDSYPFLDG